MELKRIHIAVYSNDTDKQVREFIATYPTNIADKVISTIETIFNLHFDDNINLDDIKIIKKSDYDDLIHDLIHIRDTLVELKKTK